MSNYHPNDTLPSSTTNLNNYAVAQMNNGSHTNSSTASYGSYYNGQAANVSTRTGSSGTLTYNVCAKNWTLPTLTNFTNLISKASSAWPKTLAGDYESTTIYQKGSEGYWYSRSIQSAKSMYYMIYRLSALTTSNFVDDNDALSVRCLAL